MPRKARKASHAACHVAAKQFYVTWCPDVPPRSRRQASLHGDHSKSSTLFSLFVKFSARKRCMKFMKIFAEIVSTLILPFDHSNHFLRHLSSAGQSNRLVSGRSGVRIPEVAPRSRVCLLYHAGYRVGRKHASWRGYSRGLNNSNSAECPVVLRSNYYWGTIVHYVFCLCPPKFKRL